LTTAPRSIPARPRKFAPSRSFTRSILIASGLDIVTVSRRLGHANPSITLTVYAHLFSNTDARAAEIVEAAFGGILAE
jgi:integrase